MQWENQADVFSILRNAAVTEDFRGFVLVTLFYL